jgi:hypothetical protein
MSTELPPMPRFVSDEHDARYEFSVPRTTYEDLRDEYVDLRARLQEEIAKYENALQINDSIVQTLNGEREMRMEAESRADALQKELEAVRKDGCVPIPAKTLLAIRDEIVKGDKEEAFHMLYWAGPPWKDPYKPWAEWEELAALSKESK